MATAQSTDDKYAILAREARSPGMAVVEFDATGITAEHYTGVDGNRNPITADTPFTYGSVSKSFTAATVMTLAEQGKIDLNAPITTYIPEFNGTPIGNNGATVTDLMRHTAGLPRDVSIHDDYSDEQLIQSVLDQLKTSKKINTTGTYAYSNVDYILLQLILERASEQTYSTALNAMLSQIPNYTPPMSDTATIDAAMSDGYVPFFWWQRTMHDVKHDPMIGTSYLSGTGQQLAQYGAWQLRQHQNHKLPSTLPKADQEMPDGAMGKYGAALNYRTVQTATGQEAELVQHSGSDIGYNTFLTFSPTTGKGMVILFNDLGGRTPGNRESIATTMMNEALSFNIPQPPAPFPIFSTMLAGEIVLLLLVLGFTLWKVRALFHPIPATGRRSWALAHIGIMSVLGIALAVGWYQLAASMNVSFDLVHKYAPDVSLVLYTLLAAFAAWVAVSIGYEVKRSRS